MSIHRFLISSFVLLIVLLGALFASLMRLAELHDMRTESEHRPFDRGVEGAAPKRSDYTFG